MIRTLPFLAAVLLAVPLSTPVMAQPAPVPMTLEQQMLLRCSAAFALSAGEQQRGVAGAQAYPALGERGREFFVRSAARLMDALKLTREQIQARLREEAQVLSAEPARLAEVMPPCLSALEASGL
jgi:uncharacterized protein (DUF58 family)